VTGLTLPDFQLTEDGAPCDINRLDAGQVPLNIALLLDTSESMRDALRDTQEAAVYFVESLKPSIGSHLYRSARISGVYLRQRTIWLRP